MIPATISSLELCTHAPVLVTGGTGFVAGHIIQQLLSKGYTVRTTVRDIGEQMAYAHLHKHSSGQALEVVEANLTDPDSWRAAFEGGVEFVFHVASPYLMKPQDPEVALMEPAVGGTKTILEYCQNTPSVKKLIFTSCIQTLCNEFDDALEYDETAWNETASLTRNSYAYRC